MGSTPEIKQAVSLLLMQGKSAEQIEQIISRSKFYKATKPSIVESVIQPMIENEYDDSPNSEELSTIQAAEIANKPEGGLAKLILPAAAAAIALL